MTPIADWRAVLKHAWSVRFIALSILFSALEVAVQFLHGVLPVSDGVFAILASLTTVAALVARFVVQRKMRETAEPYDWTAGKASTKAGLAGGAVGVIMLAVAIVQPWEGRELKAYQDIVGVWTICDGETRGVKPGQVATPAECDQMLYRTLSEFNAALNQCLTYPMPAQTRAAILSWTYNVGTGAACGSTLVKLGNAGDLTGMCRQLPRWNRAGGREVRGLTNRRAAEQKLCLEGLQ